MNEILNNDENSGQRKLKDEQFFVIVVTVMESFQTSKLNPRTGKTTYGSELRPFERFQKSWKHRDFGNLLSTTSQIREAKTWKSTIRSATLAGPR